LFREGTKIRTTLDKQLQDTVNAQEDTNGNARERVPERIVIVREGADIRAISCAADEDTVRTWAFSPGVQTGERTVESMATGSLEPGDLLSGEAPAGSRQD
jgi:membrane peptidoglycan carboxypeptidase